MADDDLEDLKKARNALVSERRTRVRTLASSSGAITNVPMDGLIKVQETIDLIDRLIEESDDVEELEEDE